MTGARAHALSFAIVTLPVTVSGCVATWEPEPVTVTSAYFPYDYYAYPYVIYGGHPTYWIHNHWYWQDQGTWRYYRAEPPELYRQRPYVQQAPPAPHYHYVPPAYRAPAYQAPGYQAPAYQAPGYQAPAYQAPGYRAPAYQAPSYQAPPAYHPPPPVYRAPPVLHAPMPPPAAHRVR